MLSIIGYVIRFKLDQLLAFNVKMYLLTRIHIFDTGYYKSLKENVDRKRQNGPLYMGRKETAGEVFSIFSTNTKIKMLEKKMSGRNGKRTSNEIYILFLFCSQNY